MGTGGVSITGETQFIHRLNQAFSGEGTYFAYNALALVEQDAVPYNALKALIVARNIDVMISGLGFQGDFSQFLVINGTFYSV